jgi:hypothetical protein
MTEIFLDNSVMVINDGSVFLYGEAENTRLKFKNPENSVIFDGIGKMAVIKSGSRFHNFDKNTIDLIDETINTKNNDNLFETTIKSLRTTINNQFTEAIIKKYILKCGNYIEVCNNEFIRDDGINCVIVPKYMRSIINKREREIIEEREAEERRNFDNREEKECDICLEQNKKFKKCGTCNKLCYCDKCYTRVPHHKKFRCGFCRQDTLSSNWVYE